MQADTAGDPTSDQKWSRKDTRSISQQMQERGLAISPKTVGQLLKDQNYALRVNRKSIAQTQHPERNRQFELIEDFRKQFEDADAPILSLDTKKKELIGNFRNQGQAWSQEPEEVNQHDFRSEASALAAPYGLYEPVPNRGTIIIGLSADTPEFAVDCLETWICQRGWAAYPCMKEILLLCDSGGSNGYRPRFLEIRPLPDHRPRPRPHRPGLPLPSRCLQVESGRAPAVELHQPGVGRPPAPIFGAHEEVHRRDDHGKPVSK